MVLDINLFRNYKGNDPEIVRESQKKRFKSVEIVDEIIELDEKWRQKLFSVDQNKKEYRKNSNEIKLLFKNKGKEEISGINNNELVESIKQKQLVIDDNIKKLEKEMAEIESQLNQKLNKVGNLVHESVPISQDENDNIVVKNWGECRTDQEKCKHHHELLHMIDGYDPVRGSKVAGHRGYFLKNIGVKLNQALLSYSSDFLMERNYTLLSTPLFMNCDLMAKTAQLEDFDESLYAIEEEGKEKKYLIATSEQPISAYHSDETIDQKSLPLRYAGASSCFRKEAGAYGKDTWGIFRVHQFDKVEQFCITDPDLSWDEHERMLSISEEFYKSLDIPYRVVNIVSGELNNAASKKYDLEGWFPSFGHYRELVSCSNCTDYQSRNLKIKYGSSGKYVHMLNSTLCAITRTISCIIENYQTPDGIRVPKVLQKYLNNLDFIPFNVSKN